MSDVPKQLGKYQIRRPIGKGAMGIVYEGFDPIIDRVVAIKTIKKDELEADEAEEHSRRFLIEAKAAGRLNHRNIVGIYDYGEEKGLSFIVMEFVQGKELKSFFAARHPFSMSQIVRLMGELLDALGYSHSRGVIHRDVKPDNIFITDDGSVKLGDFGIARIDSTAKTHAGTVLGTPSYMAPEQIRGETADARSDLYAAGVILYQFLVGERPFSGGMVAVMQKVLMEPPRPPSSHNPSIPPAIDAVVLRALAKSAADRFASAAEFSRALTAAVGLAGGQDESESTMIMSAGALKALQESGGADRTGTGTSTGTGTGTGGAGRSGTSGTGSRGAAVEEARRRAEETRRRYEEDLRRAELELRQAEEEQRAAEGQAQAQSTQWLASAQAQLDEGRALLEAGEALFARHTLLVDGPQHAEAARALGAKLRASAASIAEFVAASPALAPDVQAALQARQAELEAAAAAQESLAGRVDRERGAALAGLSQKLEVLEKRLSSQDGAWGVESRALEGLDAAAGEAPIGAIQARLDKLAASVDQVGKGFASLQAQPLKLPQPQAERLAVIEAQLTAQAGFVARLRTEADAARERARASVQARRTAEADAARQQAEEAGRAKAQADAEASEAKRRADEQARQRAAEAARRQAAEEAQRQAASAPAAGADDAELTMVRPVPDKAPAPPGEARTPPVRRDAPASAPLSAQVPAPAPAAGKKKGLLLPIAGAAALALAAGAWFALKPGPAVDVGPPAATPPAAQAPAAAPAPAASPAAAPVDDGAVARQRQADEEAARKAELEEQAKARAAAEAKARADEQAKAKARAEADGRAQAEAAARAKPVAAEPKTDAAEIFRLGYEAYLAGRVPEGIRQMERADAMGAPGARARLCAIYRKPTAAEGKDFLKEANKCKGVD